MLALLTRCTPFLLAFFTLAFVEAGILTEYSDARSRSGGRSFSRPTSQPAQQQQAPSQVNRQQPQQQAAAGGMGRGLMGGLIGGALGGLLLGSLFGAGGSGMGILPLLLLGGVGYFLYRRFMRRPVAATAAGSQATDGSRLQGAFGGFGASDDAAAPLRDTDPVAAGLAEIRATDPGFDEKYFLEIASDVFFKIQAGWTRRDLSSHGHLLGTQLAAEYAEHFKELKEQGRLNKLESIAVRRLEITDAGSDKGEDFVTVLFTANLLQYTVDEKTGELLEGSMTEPVKFAEKWTWARPVGTEDWKLEGIEVVED